jgi:hypothetical protein
MMLRWAIPIFLVATLFSAPVPATAHSNTNFNESHACGTAGFRGPVASRSSWLPKDELIWGPFADFFGRDYNQLADQMVRWTVPGSGGRTVMVHERALPAFNQVSANLAAHAEEGRTYRVDQAFGWSFRAVTGESHRMSFHSFGIAVDINPGRNPFLDDPEAPLITDMPEWYVDAWRDAGFCWGGDWISKRDAMHFSWKGPAATPDYGSDPVPSPAITPDAGFDVVGFSGELAIDSDAAWEYFIDDRSRDGVADIYSYRWLEPGRLRLEVSGALAGYRFQGVRGVWELPGSEATHLVVFGDYDSDNLADLWLIDRNSGATSVYGDTVPDSGLFETVLAEFTLPLSAIDQVVVSDLEGDRVADLFVADSGGAVSALSGASAFAEVVATAEVPPGTRLAVADLIFDGSPDLYAIGDQRIDTYLGGFDYGAGPSYATSIPGSGFVGVSDYDGDGRPDVFHIEDARLDIYLGGARFNSDLEAWFTRPEFTPWDVGPECLGPEACEQIGFVTDRSEFNLRDNLGWDGGDYHDFFYGVPGDIPLMGDWNCDGTDSPAMFRPSTGYVYLSNVNETVVAESEYFFGQGGDIPLAGDWDGDGCDTISIYRPAESQVYITNRLGTVLADQEYFFGTTGDRPFAGDFDGDGRDDIGLYRQSTGFVYLRLAHATGVADREFFYGAGGDQVIAGDWDGDGDDTVAVYRPVEGRWFFRLDNSTGLADNVLRAGPRNQPITPVVGAFGEFPEQ